MRTSFVIAFSALTFVFNSCQKKFDPPFDAVVNTKVDFKAQISGVELLLPFGAPSEEMMA